MIDKKQYLAKYCDLETKDGVWRLGIIDWNKAQKDEKDIVEVYLDGWSKNKIHVFIFITFREFVYTPIEFNHRDSSLKATLDKKRLH